MDFTIPEEYIQMKKVFREFIQKELLPLEEEVEEKDWFDPEIRKKLVKQISDLGFYGINFSEDVGGAGLNRLGMVIVNEEIGRISMVLGTHVFGITIPMIAALHTTEEQKEKYVLPVVRGEKKSCFGLSEPDAGSDVARLKARAVRDGDNYILNGTKHFITNALYADFSIITAITDPTAKPGRGLSTFFVDVDSPGFRISRHHKVMGMRGMGTGEIALEDCVVPAKNLVGGEGKGFHFATKEFLPYGRLWISANCVGLGDRLQEASIDWAKQRVCFEHPIAEYQAIQWMIADSALDIHASRMINYNCAWEADQGMDVLMKSSMAKLFATEMINRVADRAVQIHGCMGYADGPIERIYRDVRALKLWEGTSEIHRRLIADQLLR